MTHDTTPDASAQAIRESLRLWVKAQIAMGHSARLVNNVIEDQAKMICLQKPERET